MLGGCMDVVIFKYVAEFVLRKKVGFGVFLAGAVGVALVYNFPQCFRLVGGAEIYGTVAGFCLFLAGLVFCCQVVETVGARIGKVARQKEVNAILQACSEQEVALLKWIASSIFDDVVTDVQEPGLCALVRRGLLVAVCREDIRLRERGHALDACCGLYAVRVRCAPGVVEVLRAGGRG